MTKQEIGPAPRRLDQEPHVERRGDEARMELRITRVVVRHPALAHWATAHA